MTGYFIETLFVVILAQDVDPQAAERARAAAEAAQRAAEQRAAQQEQQDRERSQRALKDFLTDSPRVAIAGAVSNADRTRERERGIEYEKFLSAFQSFQDATQELGEALGFKAKLKNSAKNIEKSTTVFLGFLKRSSKERPRFDSSEFKDFTVGQLGWEALATAERLTPRLAAVIQNENEATTDIQFLSSLPQLEMELLRLQWMTQKLK